MVKKKDRTARREILQLKESSHPGPYQGLIQGSQQQSLIHYSDSDDENEEKPTASENKGEKQKIDLEIADFMREIESIATTQENSPEKEDTATKDASSPDASVTSLPDQGTEGKDSLDVNSTSSHIPTCVWQQCCDESTGYVYYWNMQTNEVTWDCPQEYLDYVTKLQELSSLSSSGAVTSEKVGAKKKRKRTEVEEGKIIPITSYEASTSSSSSSEDESKISVKKKASAPRKKLKKQSSSTAANSVIGPQLPASYDVELPSEASVFIGPHLPSSSDSLVTDGIDSQEAAMIGPQLPESAPSDDSVINSQLPPGIRIVQEDLNEEALVESSRKSKNYRSLSDTDEHKKAKKWTSQNLPPGIRIISVPPDTNSAVNNAAPISSDPSLPEIPKSEDLGISSLSKLIDYPESPQSSDMHEDAEQESSSEVVVSTVLTEVSDVSKDSQHILAEKCDSVTSVEEQNLVVLKRDECPKAELTQNDKDDEQISLSLKEEPDSTVRQEGISESQTGASNALNLVSYGDSDSEDGQKKKDITPEVSPQSLLAPYEKGQFRHRLGLGYHDEDSSQPTDVRPNESEVVNFVKSTDTFQLKDSETVAPESNVNEGNDMPVDDLEEIEKALDTALLMSKEESSQDGLLEDRKLLKEKAEKELKLSLKVKESKQSRSKSPMKMSQSPRARGHSPGKKRDKSKKSKSREKNKRKEKSSKKRSHKDSKSKEKLSSSHKKSSKADYEGAVRDLLSLLQDKLTFLDTTTEDINSLKVAQIQNETRLRDWEEGALDSAYFLKKLEEIHIFLQQAEKSTVPEGWSCHWDREHKRYYYTEDSTGKSQWTIPLASSEVPPDECDVQATSTSVTPSGTTTITTTTTLAQYPTVSSSTIEKIAQILHVEEVTSAQEQEDDLPADSTEVEEGEIVDSDTSCDASTSTKFIGPQFPEEIRLETNKSSSTLTSINETSSGSADMDISAVSEGICIEASEQLYVAPLQRALEQHTELTVAAASVKSAEGTGLLPTVAEAGEYTNSPVPEDNLSRISDIKLGDSSEEVSKKAETESKKERKEEVPSKKEKKKTKIAPGLALKKKNLPTLLAKWEKIKEEQMNESKKRKKL